MTRLFIGNFAWEHQLIGGQTLSRPLRRMEAELCPAWLAVAREGDEILIPELPDDEYATRLHSLGLPTPRWLTPDQIGTSRATQLVPWGWSPEWEHLARRHFPDSVIPPYDAVKTANSREFQFGLCQQLDCLLPGEALVSSSQELETHLVRFAPDHKWVLKSNFGFAGRGQKLVTQATWTSQVADWVQKSLRRSGPLHIEPWLQEVCQLGGQWNIPNTGSPELVGITELYSTQQGAYRGSRTSLGTMATSCQPVVVHTQRLVVERIQHMGICGPVGIDAMIHATDNGIQVRPIQDVNVRWTMGRLALEWRDLFKRINQAGEGLWLHGSICELPGAVDLSPHTLGSEPLRTRQWWIPHPSMSATL